MKTLWLDLSNSGVTADLPYEAVRRIRLQNQVSLLGSFCLIIFTVSNLLHSNILLALIETGFTGLVGFNIFLNYKKQYLLASVLLLLEIYIFITLLTFVLSPYRSLEYLFLVAVIMPLAFYKRKTIIYSFFLAGFALFLTARYLTEGKQDLLLYLNYTLIFFLLFFVVKYLKDEFENHRKVIESQNTLLEKLNAEKNQLISIASHDLRSPLNRIQSLLSLLSMEGSLTLEQKDILQTAQREAKQQAEMISEILDLYAIDEGRRIIKLESVEVPVMIENLMTAFQPLATKKNIITQLENKAERSACMADPNYLKQILDNLLSNAIKFSYPNSSITITLRSTSQTLQISIKDEGQGLDAEDQKKLFMRFQRLSARPTAGEVTTGLGLSIAKKYTDAMSGSLTCVSDKGKGATFTVELLLSQS